MITNLRLTQSDGKPLHVSDYRQKQNLVILFVDEAGSDIDIPILLDDDRRPPPRPLLVFGPSVDHVCS